MAMYVTGSERVADQGPRAWAANHYVEMNPKRSIVGLPL